MTRPVPDHPPALPAPGRPSRARLALTLAATALAAAVLAPVTATASCAAHPSLRDGRYANVDPDTRSITTVELAFVCGSTRRTTPDGLVVIQHGGDPHWNLRLWGRCHPRDCDWGRTRGTEGPNRSNLRADYDQGFARRTVFVMPAGGNEVTLHVRTVYTDGRASRTSVDRLRRQ